MHSVDCFIFKEELVIFRDSNEEEYRRHILKAMDPFLSFRSLATDIKHAISEFANDEGSLCYASGLDTRSENILVIREVVWLRYSFYGVEVARVDSQRLHAYIYEVARCVLALSVMQTSSRSSSD